MVLRDVQGRLHPVMADVGCRNTVFGAEAQEASAHLSHWLKTGIVHYRIEFVHESADLVTQVTSAFRQTLTGQITPQELQAQWRKITPTTEGSLFVPHEYLTLPIMD